MSDINLRGVSGLLVMAATVGLCAIWTLAAFVAAKIIRARGREPFRTAFMRCGIGPLLSLIASGIALSSSLDGAGEGVDRAGPWVCFVSLGAGVLVTIALRWWRPPTRT